MIRLSFDRLPERCLWGGILFCTVYLSYRYPLQINASGTSPTYADTPFFLQIPKFVVMLLLCLATLLYIPGRVIPYRKWCLVAMAVFMSIYPFIKAIGAEPENWSSYAEVAFWPMAALILTLASTPVRVSSLDKYFRFVFLYAMVSTAVEVSLFLLTGRLPALAYSGSFSVRFGGFLDDPNGFAAILFMLIGWAYYRFSGKKRLLTESALVVCVLLTQSLTAFGFLGLIALIATVYRFIYKSKLPLVLSLGGVVTAIATVWPSISSVVAVLVETRSGSVDAHLSQVNATTAAANFDWLFGGQNFKDYESWWVSSAVNFGTPWALLSASIVAIISFSVFHALRHAKSQQEKAVMSAISMLSCYFIVGSLNLPFFKIFPVSFLFFALSYLVFFDRIEPDAPPLKARHLGSVDPARNQICSRPA